MSGQRKAGRDKNRDETIVALCAGGATMREVGGLFGVSHQRVRQILDRNDVGARGNPRVDPLKVLAAVRHRDAWNMQALLRATGYSAPAIRRALTELGCAAAVRRLMRWRASCLERANREALLDRLRALAVRLGHTPDALECYDAGLWQASLERACGSRKAAMLAAGLRPNPRGRPRVPA